LDFRGSGASPARFAAQATRYDRDIAAAADEARDLGSKKVFVVGASLGGAAVLKAAPSLDPQPAGVVSLSGEPQLLDAMQSAPRLKAPLLVLITRDDGYSSVEDNRRLVRAAGSADKKLVVYPGTWHGWDLLYHAPYKARVNALVFEFLREHSQ
jgi:dienelactone hydrolase